MVGDRKLDETKDKYQVSYRVGSGKERRLQKHFIIIQALSLRMNQPLV